MKKCFLLCVLLACWLLPKTVSAQEVSIQFFHDSLSPYGAWIHVEDYGDCWQPYVDDPDWHPYALGHWAYTDQGWLWISDEPFGWATYHYGSWINIEGRGWCWVPGHEWAPAWVTWRYGDGYCGWAPMPPSRFVGEVGPGWYNFCDARSMGEPSLRLVIVNRSYNYTYINRTVLINNYVAIGKRRHYEGPPIAEVNRFAGPRPVPHYAIERHAEVNWNNPDAYRPQAHGGTINVFAPPVHRENRPAPYPYPSANVAAPVVNDGRNVYHPPTVGPYAPPSVVPNRWQNRAATSSVYKHEPTPPMPTANVTPFQNQPQPQPRPQRPQPTYAPSNGPAQNTPPNRGQPQNFQAPRGDHAGGDEHGGGHRGH